MGIEMAVEQKNETEKEPEKENEVKEEKQTGKRRGRFKLGLLGFALAALVGGYALVKDISYRRINVPPAYEYALSRGLEKKLTQSLSDKLTNFDGNAKKFIDIISSRSREIQEACVGSDILDNGHVSDRELENTRKATSKGIVNPREAYVILMNGSGPDNPEWYSQQNAEYSLANLLSVYKLFKTNGVADKNIRLLISNPSNTNFYETALHDFFKNGGRFFALNNGKKSYSNVPFSKLLVMPGDEIEVDGESIKANFSESNRVLHPDNNDDLYLVISDPGFNEKIPPFVKSGTRSRQYIKFFDEEPKEIFAESSIVISDYLIGDYQSNNIILLVNSHQSLGLVKKRYIPTLSTPEKTTGNLLAIASSNLEGFANETFIADFVDKVLRNPKRSIADVVKELGEIHKEDGHQPNVFYYGRGINRPLEECSRFYEPFIIGQK